MSGDYARELGIALGIALDRVARGEDPAQVYTDTYPAVLRIARRSQEPVNDPVATTLLIAALLLDEEGA